MDLSGANVLVTGAASGIGRVIARRLAESGVRCVACLDIHDASNAETAEMVERAGADAVTVNVDLGDVDSIRRAYAEALTAMGGLDAAAHIGGYSWRGETLEVTQEQWDSVVNVNLRGTFFCCQQALRTLYAQGRGAIVNMSADAAFHPIPGFAVQSAAKGGIHLMTRTLALEAARLGVRVNTVSPGIVHVPRVGRTAEHGSSVRSPQPAVRSGNADAESLPEQTAGGRWIEAEEVADTVLYLCSPAASGISGELVSINAGGYFSLQY